MLPDSRALLTAATAGPLLDTTGTVLNRTANPITRDLTVNAINYAATPMDLLWLHLGARHQRAPTRTAGPGGRRHRSRQPPAPPKQHPDPKRPP